MRRSFSRLLAWYDALTDWQRVQYAVAAMLFLLACAGYLLGLGSAVLLRRVEARRESLALAAPIAVTAQPSAEPTVPTPAPPPDPQPTTDAAVPELAPTPFSAPRVAEIPLVRRTPVPAVPDTSGVRAPAPAPPRPPATATPLRAAPTR